MTAVDEVLTEMARAWNAGDGTAWAANFAEDADFVDVVGRVQRGRDVIAAEHQKIFDTIYRGSHLEIWQVDSRPLDDRTLLVHTASTLRVPAGPRAGEWHGIQTKVFRDGEILAFHNTGRADLADFAHHDEALADRTPQEWGRIASS
ncbi:SgcJ/EcaC family oxidoreductase [Saccharopolyspora erythraea]|uniref:SgcJ/EcaC family oxidoreductase n=1 Tax=Saccharopolyspora erythraea TaxID=1836 RepID=UPI001BA5DBD2|nr:SgcJ/EcaC family oxidoreductase [Saccharopolyspora erythraea]QUG99740.1 SgcJ/EcaC family oxidoreductase [Saccharopolyspora erythraea]